MKSEAKRSVGRQPRRKRHFRSAEPMETVTLQLPTSIAEAIRAVVRAGEVSSAGIFIEEAVTQRLRQRRRERVYAAYAEASRDPVFLAEMERVEREFDVATGDDHGYVIDAHNP